jgi:hypothetical protein
MSSIKILALGLCGAILLAANPCGLRAQAPKAPELPTVELSGKIVKLGSGVIEVSTDAIDMTGGKEAPKEKPTGKAKTQTVAVAVHPKNTQVQVSGTTSGKFLRVGQYVRFSGKMDENGKPQDDVGVIEVFTPDANFQAKLDVRLPAPKFASDAPDTKTRSFDASGRVAAFQRGQLTVLCDAGKRLTIPVTDATQVNFTLASLALAKPGDAITVSGRLFRPGRVIAERVGISVAAEEKKEKVKEKVEPKKKEKEPEKDQ